MDSKINSLPIILKQGMFGTVRDYCIDSKGRLRLAQVAKTGGGGVPGVYRELGIIILQEFIYLPAHIDYSTTLHEDIVS
jgi:hypothetical protein